MKNYIVLFFICFLVACQTDAPVNSTASVVPSAKDNSVKRVTPKKVEKDVLTPLVGRWEAKNVISIRNNEERESYVGSWYQLNMDQTFTFGQYESQLSEGTYTYDADSEIIDLYFYPSGQKVASQYKIQGLGAYDGTTVIWLGNTPKNPKGMQLKMVKEQSK